MASLDVKRRHPDYEVWTGLEDFLWPSYLGGREYRLADMLDKYPRELDTVHAARKQRAYYLNYTAAVVDSYVSEVYKRDPSREVPDSFSEFLEGATLDGLPLEDFVSETLTRVVASTRAFVVVDVDDSGTPYVHLLHPSNLLDFSVDDNGSYNWALVAEKTVVDEDPFADRAEETRYRLWLPSEWVLFDAEGKETRRQTNVAGVVPIIPIDPGSMPLPIFDIAMINKRIYNLGSQLDEILINVTFPQMYAQSGEGVEDERGEAISDDVSPIAVGASRLLLLPTEANMPPGFLAPPDGPAKLHIEERERLVQAIYSLAGLQRQDPEAQLVQSGVAKAYDFKETNARLSSLAQVAEGVEVQIFELLNLYGMQGEANISYRKDFDVRDFQLMLEDHLKITKAALPFEAKRRSAVDVSTRIAEEASPEERKEITEAAQNMKPEDFAPTPAAQTPGGALTGGTSEDEVAEGGMLK